MGTSKGYQAPTTPQWGKQKGDVTRASRNGAVSQEVARDIVRGYIQANGGSETVSQGGGTIGGSRSVQKTGQRLAGFVSSVASRGLEKALQDEGLSDLIGHPAKEVALALADRLCEDGSTLDEVDTRNALSDLMDELLEKAETYEEVKEIFEKTIQVNELGNLLTRFFGHYLYRQFCRVFYERLVTKHGEKKASGFLTSIKDMISSLVRLKTFDKDLSKINWIGEEGASLADSILEQTYKVFDR